MRINIISVTYKESFMNTPIYEFKKNYKGYELSFINTYNCSDSNEIKEYDNLLEICTTQNDGLAGGYNLALEHLLPCDYVLFLNSDCILSNEILDAYAESLRGSKGLGKVFAPKLFCNNKQISPFTRGSMREKYWIIAWTLVSYDVVRDFRFPLKYWLDGIDYFYSAWLRKNQLHVIEIPYNQEHDLSMSSNYAQTPDWRIVNAYDAEFSFFGMRSFFKILRGSIRALLARRTLLAFKILAIPFRQA